MKAILESLYPHLKGGGHIVFGVDPIDVGLLLLVRTLSCEPVVAQYLVNQWLDSYQIFMDI